MDVVKRKSRLSRYMTVFGTVVVFAASFLYLWAQGGGSMPDIGEPKDYRVSFHTDDILNLQNSGDVDIAGVVVGHVAERLVDRDDDASVTVSISPEAAPLHEGVKIQVKPKGVLGASYVDIVDGDGAPIPSDTTLPDSAVTPSVDINDVLETLDPKTRNALRGTIRSLGTATEGTSGDLSKLMTGLGNLGREGHTALDAIAAQSDDLKALTREATTLLDALDTGQGQIAAVVRDARTLTEATAGQRRAIEDTMQATPRLLGSARVATGELGELSGPLAPVAADLKAAAPDLNSALQQLPAVTNDLRGLLPALDGTLDAAPATLERIPTFGSDVRTLVPGAELMLRDINPMLAYMKPYGRDVGAMIASFGASFDLAVENGIRPIRLSPIFNSASLRGNPLPMTIDPNHWNNPYPTPGQMENPAPFSGEYPRVERAPK